MEAVLYVAAIGLPLWWVAQMLWCLRDYFRRRAVVRDLPPPDEEEKDALARLFARPQAKENKTLRWYAEHPREAVKAGFAAVPFFLFFWPMTVLLLLLPPLPTRLTPQLIKQVQARFPPVPPAPVAPQDRGGQAREQ